MRIIWQIYEVHFLSTLMAIEISVTMAYLNVDRSATVSITKVPIDRFGEGFIGEICEKSPDPIIYGILREECATRAHARARARALDEIWDG